MTLPNAHSARGRVAALTRSREPDDPAMIAAYRDLAVANAATWIHKFLDGAPAITSSQAGELASLVLSYAEVEA